MHSPVVSDGSPGTHCCLLNHRSDSIKFTVFFLSLGTQKRKHTKKKENRPKAKAQGSAVGVASVPPGLEG